MVENSLINIFQRSQYFSGLFLPRVTMSTIIVKGVTKKILIIEDDRDISELIQYNLKQDNMLSETCFDGVQGLERAIQTLPTLIVLDLMLPSMDGLDICKKLKAHSKTKDIPVLMLTAKAEEIDRVVGLELGADDYLTKPFSPRELVLRIRAILRRFEAVGQDDKTKIQTFGLLKVYPSKHQVMVRDREVRLTAIEFKLLHYLLTRQGHVATRDVLLNHVWGYEAELTTRTVDTHIKRLREKLRDAGDYIETVHGVGYRMTEKPEGIS